MRLSRSSKGILVLAVVLILFSLLFDLLAAAIAGVGLIIFLSLRAFLFLSALSLTAQSLIIQRSLSSRFARSGFPLKAETNIQVVVPTGFSAEISDLIPQDAILTSGTLTASLNKSQSSSLNYTLIIKTPGEHTYGGVRLCLSDDFFSGDLVCRIQEPKGFSVIILPTSEYPLALEPSYHEEESSMLPPFAGPEVRSFRKSLPGDDLRKIDWKISAKNNALFIREYMGQLDEGSLLIVDLPDTQHPYNTEEFRLLKEAAMSVISKHNLFRKEVSVLLIGGPNLISFTQLESNTRRLVEIITQLTPTPRLHYMYRYSSTSTLKQRFALLSRSIDPLSRNLIRISNAFLAHRPPDVFESQMALIFHSISAARTVHIFTLNFQDNSHIRIISNLAAARGMNIQFHTPGINSNTFVKAWFNQRFSAVRTGV